MLVLAPDRAARGRCLPQTAHSMLCAGEASTLEGMKNIDIAKVHDLRSGDNDPDGTNVLVDRIWPRGVAKDDVDLAEWLKEVAPSPDLRKWFDHDEDKFDDFTKKYRKELDEIREELDSADSEDSDELSDAAQDLATLLKLAKKASKTTPLVLVYGAKDREINHANVLADWLGDQ